MLLCSCRAHTGLIEATADAGGLHEGPLQLSFIAIQKTGASTTCGMPSPDSVWPQQFANSSVDYLSCKHFHNIVYCIHRPVLRYLRLTTHKAKAKRTR